MYEVVVGIDFGSSGTGYAYSYNNKEDIIMGKFPGQGIDAKVPSQIILNSSMEILAFGEDCKKYIDDGRLRHNDLVFKKIKMNLYEDKKTITSDNGSSTFPIEDIIAKVLEYVKNEAIKTIKSNKPKIKEDQIKWVVTVPAIWKLSQKGIMMKASEKAGLFNKNTNRLNFFALEPEAASLYCSNNNSIDKDFIQPGKTYMICDLGGGTGDIVTHNISLNNQIYEKYPPIGGNYGSDEIDKQIFRRIFKKLFGFENFEDLQKKNVEKNFPWKEDELYCEWNNLQYEIQIKKKIKNEEKDQTFSLNCQIFQELIDLDITNLVDNYNKSCKEDWKINIKNKQRWILIFPYKIFFDLIEEHADKISTQLIDVYEKVDDIESILYVGGYCSNPILLNRIKKQFRELAHLTPSRPEIAVVKGAVLFGLNSDIINVRKAKYTIGFKTTEIWDEEKHGNLGQKYYDYEENVYRCSNIFDSFIRRGQDISINDIITHNFIMLGPRFISLQFFKTLNPNPILCTEEGVDLIGSDSMDLGRNYAKDEREIIVKMKFGGTFCEATCIHTKSGIEKSLPLYFN